MSLRFDQPSSHQCVTDSASRSPSAAMAGSRADAEARNQSSDRRVARGRAATSTASGARRGPSHRLLVRPATQTQKPHGIETVDDHVPTNLSVVRREALKHRIHLRPDVIAVLDD